MNSLFGDFFREFWRGILGGVRDYLGEVLGGFLWKNKGIEHEKTRKPIEGKIEKHKNNLLDMIVYDFDDFLLYSFPYMFPSTFHQKPPLNSPEHPLKSPSKIPWKSRREDYWVTWVYLKKKLDGTVV